MFGFCLQLHCGLFVHNPWICCEFMEMQHRDLCFEADLNQGLMWIQRHV